MGRIAFINLIDSNYTAYNKIISLKLNDFTLSKLNFYILGSFLKC